MSNKNGLAKNWEHIQEELSDWQLFMVPHWRQFKAARGVAEKAHKAVNLVTESVRLLPYTLSHALIVWVVVDGGVHVWLWLR